MAYKVYLDDLLLPVAPPKLSVKAAGQNKTENLINGEEINLPAPFGLTEITFDALIPHISYPFAEYEDGFLPVGRYMEYLEDLKRSRRPFQFTCIREGADGDSLFDTDMDVTMEDYKIVEDAKEGLDVTVSVTLKEYEHYGTKKVNITIMPEESAPVAQAEPTRASDPPPKTYTVAAGDCLWNIAKKVLGNGARYPEIFELNRDKISNPNLIYPGQTLLLPG